MPVQEQYRRSPGPEELYVFIMNLGYCQSWSFAWNTMLRCQLRSPDWAGTWAVRADQIWTLGKGLDPPWGHGQELSATPEETRAISVQDYRKNNSVKNRSKKQTTMAKVHAQFGRKKSATTVGNLGAFIQSDWAERALLKELTHPILRFICTEPTCGWDPILRFICMESTCGWDHVRIDFSAWLKK